mmetsp:Transcript_30350/g.116399  ORF Transcript_30350/g.116399 Transcript_30350/m.116399 type:complete len:279 (-) Transcript_30350:497-1333(-)
MGKYRFEMSIHGTNFMDLDRRSKSDPFAVVFVKEPSAGDFKEFGRTETVWEELSPRFVTKFLVDNVPMESRLRIVFCDRDSELEKLTKHDFIGEVQFQMKELLEDRTSLKSFVLQNENTRKHAGTTFLGVDRILLPSPNRMMTFEIRFGKVERLLSSMTKCFLEFLRPMESGGWTPVYRTESTRVETSSPFELLSLEESMLNAGVETNNTRIEVWKIYSMSQETKLVAYTEFSLADMLRTGKGFGTNFIRDDQVAKASWNVISLVSTSSDFGIRLDNF